MKKMGPYNEACIDHSKIIQLRIFEDQRPNDCKVDIRSSELSIMTSVVMVEFSSKQLTHSQFRAVSTRNQKVRTLQ